MAAEPADSGQWKRAVCDGLDFLAFAVSDLPCLFVEQAGRFETIRHFSERDHRLNFDGKVDVRVRLCIFANRLEPVPFVHTNVFGLQAVVSLHFDVLSELLLWSQLNALTAVPDVQRSLMRVDDEARTLLGNGTAG